MSEFKGTKGKWRFDDLNFVVKAIDDGNPSFQTVIAHVNSKFDYSPGRQTQFYNAKLISCAPELLEYLININNFIKENKSKNYMIELLSREVPNLSELIEKSTKI